MSDMVDKVADAILGRVPFGYGMTRAEAIEYARTAIKTMREPTTEMRWAGYDREAFAPSSNVSSIQFDALPIWQLMIDEALK